MKWLIGSLIAGMCLLDQCRDSDNTDLVTDVTENVIVVIIDGPRFSETWGDSAGNLMPFIKDSMLSAGVLLTNFYNDGATETTAGHTAMLTGFYQEINNFGEELPDHPSVFQYFRKSKSVDSTATWVIASKHKLEVLTDCKDSTWQHQFRPAHDCGVSGLGSSNRADSLTLARALDVLNTYHPKLTLIHFKEPDVSAHDGNWDAYIKGIRDGDRAAFTVWKFINNDPIYANHTALFVTHDHGRHLDSLSDGFVSHGDSCPGCRHIALYAYGPEFDQDRIVIDRYSQIDLAVTIASLLRFTLEGANGNRIDALFK
ncbi:sulfatase [bacterium]|nr:sulfatase [bacterium]